MTDWKDESNYRKRESVAKSCITCSAFKLGPDGDRNGKGRCEMFKAAVDGVMTCDDWSDSWKPKTADSSLDASNDNWWGPSNSTKFEVGMPGGAPGMGDPAILPGSENTLTKITNPCYCDVGPSPHEWTGSCEDVLKPVMQHEAMAKSWYHLTDNPQFALNPEYNPQNNTTLGGDWPHKGLFVTGDPQDWYDGHDYVRPYVAELEGNANDVRGHSREHFIPATEFGNTSIKRVIPYDAYMDETWEGTPYTGPDVRTFTPEQHQEALRAANDYIRNSRPHMLSFPCSSCGSKSEGWNECQSCGAVEDPSVDRYQKRGYLNKFKGKGDFYKLAADSAPAMPQADAGEWQHIQPPYDDGYGGKLDHEDNWVWLDGKVGWGGQHHQIADDLARQLGYPQDRVAYISNMISRNHLPEQHAVAIGTMQGIYPQIYMSTRDRNAVWDDVARDRQKTSAIKVARTTMYHASDPENRQSIQAQGLLASLDGLGGDRRLYFMETPAEAQKFFQTYWTQGGQADIWAADVSDVPLHIDERGYIFKYPHQSAPRAWYTLNNIPVDHIQLMIPSGGIQWQHPGFQETPIGETYQFSPTNDHIQRQQQQPVMPGWRGTFK